MGLFPRILIIRDVNNKNLCEYGHNTPREMAKK